VGGPPDRRSFSRCISALDYSNSARNRASAILNFKVHTKYIPKRSGFKSHQVLTQIFSTNNLVHVKSYVRISKQYQSPNAACGKWPNPTAANQFVVPRVKVRLH